MSHPPREHDFHRRDEDGYISTVNPLHAKSKEGSATERVNKLKEEKISDADKRHRYKRGSIVDRYRRASIFDEIVSQMVENQPKDQSQNSDAVQTHRGGREKRIQHIQALGVSQSHRARLIAFELAAKEVMKEEEQKRTDETDYPYTNEKKSELADETWYFNPYSLRPCRGYTQRLYIEGFWHFNDADISDDCNHCGHQIYHFWKFACRELHLFSGNLLFDVHIFVCFDVCSSKASY